jgi:hypothetical protein
VQKFSHLPGFDPCTIQPIAICYTDYAVLATNVQDAGQLVVGGSRMWAINWLKTMNDGIFYGCRDAPLFVIRAWSF